MERCVNCKHYELDLRMEPCKSCDCSNSNFQLKEIEEDVKENNEMNSFVEELKQLVTKHFELDCGNMNCSECPLSKKIGMHDEHDDEQDICDALSNVRNVIRGNE